jgi:DNA-binding phage protein
MLNTAKDADIDRASLSRILSEDTDPRASTLAEIANVLGYRLTFVRQCASLLFALFHATITP